MAPANVPSGRINGTPPPNGASPPFVAEPVGDDPVIAAVVADAFVDFPDPLEPLAVDALVERLAQRLAERAEVAQRLRRSAVARRAVERARRLSRAHAAGRACRLSQLTKALSGGRITPGRVTM